MKTTLKRTLFAAIVGLALLPMSGAHAHDSAKGPNGGAMVQIDDKHLEFVSNSDALTLYLTDAKHDPVATAGASGRAVLLVDGKTSTIALVPTVPNLLTGKPEALLPKGARVVVSASLPGGTNVQARFVVP